MTGWHVRDPLVSNIINSRLNYSLPHIPKTPGMCSPRTFFRRVWWTPIYAVCVTRDRRICATSRSRCAVRRSVSGDTIGPRCCAINSQKLSLITLMSDCAVYRSAALITDQAVLQIRRRTYSMTLNHRFTVFFANPSIVRHGAMLARTSDRSSNSANK